MLSHLLILLALLLLNGLFAMAEMAVVSSRPTSLREMAKADHGGARAALRLLEDPTRFLSTVQIGITARASPNRWAPGSRASDCRCRSRSTRPRSPMRSSSWSSPICR
jgi:hypothetical protein